MIRVLLAEDAGGVRGGARGGLATLLGMEPDVEVVGRVGRGDEVVDAALVTRPEVVLLDVGLPGGGFDAAAELAAEVPDCRVLLLAAFARPGDLRRATEAGAAGFLVKDGPVEELAAAIRAVIRGETVVDPALAAAAGRTSSDAATARSAAPGAPAARERPGPEAGHPRDRA